MNDLRHTIILYDQCLINAELKNQLDDCKVRSIRFLLFIETHSVNGLKLKHAQEVITSTRLHFLHMLR